MKNSQTVSSYEYKNDFLYIVIRETPERGPQTYLYCCGINTSRFDPLCWGKAGICSNPAFKGLQLLRADVSAFAMKKSILPKPAEVNDCALITPPGHGWYRENLLLTEAAPGIIPELIEFSVLDLVKTVLVVCAPDAKVPVTLPDPPALQKWLMSLGVKDYIAAAPPPIAKRQV